MNLTDRFLFSETAEDLQTYEAMVSIFMEEEIAVVNWTETEKECGGIFNEKLNMPFINSSKCV